MSRIELEVDDLSAPDVAELVRMHLADMYATSPACSVHAVDLSGLRDPAITLWVARVEGRLAGIGALKRLDPERGELKSMRVADGFRGTGVGRALVRHAIAAARAEHLRSLWLETGTSDAFLAARSLYASEGFTPCPPFGSYTDDPLSFYMTMLL